MVKTKWLIAVSKFSQIIFASCILRVCCAVRSLRADSQGLRVLPLLREDVEVAG